MDRMNTMIVSILGDIFELIDKHHNDMELGKALREYKHDLDDLALESFNKIMKDLKDK